MSQQPKKAEFAAARPKALSMPEALSRARESMSMINPAPIDSVRSCSRDEDGGWRATFDVIESPARMGDNDLLSAYELKMSDGGELLDFRRIERFYREDRLS